METSVVWDDYEKNVYIYTSDFKDTIRKKVKGGQLKELIGYNFGELVRQEDDRILKREPPYSVPYLSQNECALFFGGYGRELKLSGVHFGKGCSFFGIEIGKDSARRLIDVLEEPAYEGIDEMNGDYLISYRFGNGIEIYATYSNLDAKTLESSINLYNKSVT